MFGVDSFLLALKLNEKSVICTYHRIFHDIYKSYIQCVPCSVDLMIENIVSSNEIFKRQKTLLAIYIYMNTFDRLARQIILSRYIRKEHWYEVCNIII